MAQFPTFEAGGDPTHTFKGITVVGLFRPLPKITGRVYQLIPTGTIGSIAVTAVDTIYFNPFFVPDTIRFTAAKLRVLTGGAGSSVKVGIWNNSVISNRPVGAPIIADNTGVATTASNATVTPALAGTLTSGFYWLGLKTTGTPPTLQVSQSSAYSYMMGSSDPAYLALSYADAYANPLATIAEGATFTETGNGDMFTVAVVSA